MSSGFNFSSNNDNSPFGNSGNNNTGPKPNLNFGSNSTSNNAALPAGNTSTVGGFGASNSSTGFTGFGTNATPSTTAPPATGPTFSFGNTVGGAKSSTPMFGNSSTTTPVAAAAAAAAATTTTTPAASATLFSGAAGSKPQSSLFATAPTNSTEKSVIGSSKPAVEGSTSRPFGGITTGTQATSGFNIGGVASSTTTQNQQSTTLSQQADKTPSTFSFSSKTGDDQMKSTPSFSFGTTAATPFNAFSLGAKTDEKKEPATSFSFASKLDEKKNDFKPTMNPSFGSNQEEKKNDDKPINPSFSFGIKTDEKKAETNSTTSFSFGSKSEEKKNDSKPTLGFSFGTKPEEKKTDIHAPTVGFSFGSKPEEKKDETKPNTGLSFGSKSEEKKDEKKLSATGLTFDNKTDLKKEPSEVMKSEEKKVTFDVNLNDTTKTPVKLEDFKPQKLSINNKNMDDLITKWTNQLSFSSKTFEAYSEKIGEWDKTLVTSSNAVSKLYNDTIQCEQKQERIDQTLAYIENQQEELERLLTSYEKQSDKLLASIEKSSSTAGGPISAINNKETNDEAREKAYKLAEMLENKLDSLGHNFSSLVTEVNDVSENFNKSLINEDVTENEQQNLNDIIKLLNNHMESLNWISENEKLLKKRVEQLSLSKQ